MVALFSMVSMMLMMDEDWLFSVPVVEVFAGMYVALCNTNGRAFPPCSSPSSFSTAVVVDTTAEPPLETTVAFDWFDPSASAPSTIGPDDEEVKESSSTSATCSIMPVL